jgi:hypothetical protein
MTGSKTLMGETVLFLAVVRMNRAAFDIAMVVALSLDLQPY